VKAEEPGSFTGGTRVQPHTPVPLRITPERRIPDGKSEASDGADSSSEKSSELVVGGRSLPGGGRGTPEQLSPPSSFSRGQQPPNAFSSRNERGEASSADAGRMAAPSAWFFQRRWVLGLTDTGWAVGENGCDG